MNGHVVGEAEWGGGGSYIAKVATHDAAGGQVQGAVFQDVPLLRAGVRVVDGLDLAGAKSVLVQVGHDAVGGGGGTEISTRPSSAEEGRRCYPAVLASRMRTEESCILFSERGR